MTERQQKPPDYAMELLDVLDAISTVVLRMARELAKARQAACTRCDQVRCPMWQERMRRHEAVRD